MGVELNMKWQPIATAPPNCGLVLVYANVVFMATLRDGVWRKWSSDLILEPTHWMPLPKDPDEE